MAKGYSFQGLVDSVLMRLNLLSEIKEQGNKAQKEARDNLDVYGKEQTYNKLETDNHISLVVDNAPSTLNTLNKLAKAINNNPKFAEKIHLLIDQKLSKNDNGADIPDKNLFVKNLDLTEAVDCAKNALDKRTGGTVNGNIIVEGNKLSLKGDDRKHLGFHNQDGSVRMWLYKDKGGDGVRLNNGGEGAGDWVFHKNGHFYSPQALHAAGATYQEDGNIHGSAWGGHLSHWLNQNCVLNVQLGARQVNPGFSGRFDTPGGCVMTSAHGDSDNWISAQYAPIQIWKNNQWVTIAG